MSRALLVLNSDHQRRRASDWAWSLKPGTRVEFKAPKRTDDQNSMMWVLLTKVSIQLKWHGRHLTPDDWKLQFLDALRRAKNEELRIIPNIDNTGFVNLSASSSDLSKDEMSDMIELIYKFGAEHGVKFNEPVDVSIAGGQSSGAADPSTSPAAIQSEPADGGPAEAGEPEVAHGAATAPASEPSAEDCIWLKLVARMLWAATGVGEQDTLKRQMAGIRENHTPATVNDAARAKANSINLKCKQVCFGDLGAGDVLPLIAGIAGCEVKDIVS
jgi:NinB protein